MLCRPRLGIDPKKIRFALEQIGKVTRPVAPIAAVTAAQDPDDNIFLECAEAAQADYLVTGNLRHFPDQWRKTRVVGPRELIGCLLGEGGEVFQEGWR